MYFKLVFRRILIISSHGKLLRSFVYAILYCVGAGITTCTSISDGVGPVLFLWKDGKHALHEGRNGRRGAYFPPKLAFFTL